MSMKYLKKYNESIESIESICQKYGIKNYTINQDGSIDVNGDVYLSSSKLTKLPLKFNKVSGSFECSRNQLISLEGSPREARGDFYCSDNELKSLKGGPIEVGGNFYCSYNKLTSLEGSPVKIGRSLYCNYNRLTSLDGGPIELVNLYCHYNPISNIFKLFKNYNEFRSLLDDYSYLRGTNIIRRRFEEACIEAGIKVPDKIEGYNYI